MPNRAIVWSLLVLAMTVALPAVPSVPEIDATTGASALTPTLCFT